MKFLRIEDGDECKYCVANSDRELICLHPKRSGNCQVDGFPGNCPLPNAPPNKQIQPDAEPCSDCNHWKHKNHNYCANCGKQLRR